MSKEKKCCREETKCVEAQLECKATGEVEEQVAAELKQADPEDGSLAELLAEEEAKAGPAGSDYSFDQVPKETLDDEE